VNLPLSSLDANTTSPFSDAAVLEAQWRELDALFKLESSALSAVQGRRVLLVCYGGNTARVATSVLRARGIDASSIRGGYQAVAQVDLLQNGNAQIQAQAHGLTPLPSRENEKSAQSIVTVELN
jgi:rhodanese-related sulfurtransferase